MNSVVEKWLDQDWVSVKGQDSRDIRVFARDGKLIVINELNMDGEDFFDLSIAGARFVEKDYRFDHRFKNYKNIDYFEG